MGKGTSLMPPWLGAVTLLVLLAAAAASVVWWRRWRVLAAWRSFARLAEGTLDADAGRLKVRGRWQGFALFLQQAVSHEEEAPYAHTRGALNVRNPANVVLGVRHKSLLEEVQTRKVAPAVPTDDADFGRAFFLVLTTPEHLQTLLPQDVRRRLARYGDIELYLRNNQLEWRRAGTVTSAAELRDLFALTSDVAAALDALPPRTISLSQKLADEALIERGV